MYSVKTSRFSSYHNKVCLAMIGIMLYVVIFSMHGAFAVPTVAFDVTQYTTGDVAVITVNDASANLNLTAKDTVQVLVSSNSHPSGIPVILTETGVNTGIFKNSYLAFNNGSALYRVGNKIFVTVTDPIQDTDPNTRQTLDAPIASFFPDLSPDSSINPFILTETGNHTGVFTTNILLTGGPTNGNSLHVTAGDLLQITNQRSGKLYTALVNPTPAGVNYLPVIEGNNITASYSGITTTARIVVGIFPGGVGGGIIQSGLVLDAILAVGGSPYIVSPPSFGGNYYHYSDGLMLTQGNDMTTFDISHYNQEIPKQVMVTGEKVNMTFKTFESYYSEGVIHMGLYLIPHGHDMQTTSSISSIEWQKGKPVQVKDPNHILLNATAHSKSDGKFQYTEFLFTPAKSYDKMSFLVRAWNDHMYTTDVRVHDAIDIPPPETPLPNGVIRYDSFADLQSALYRDQFYKPEIMAHIHDTNGVFPSSTGIVYWLYDTIDHSVTLVVANTDNPELFSYKSPLQPYAIEKKGDYKFMHFTVKQLSRWNVEQMKKALKDEEEKAMSIGLEKKIIPHSNW